MAGFTKGPYSLGASSDAGLVVWSEDTIVAGFPGPAQSEMGSENKAERRANRDLAHAAFNAATAIEEAGYDGQAAIEELAALVEALAVLLDDCAASADYDAVMAATLVLSRIRKGGA